MALLEGTKMNLGGREFIVPPLNIRGLRLLGPKFDSITKACMGAGVSALLSVEVLDDMMEVIHTAIVRNYPNVTKDELEDLVDLDTLPKLFQAVAAQSGMQQAVPGEVTAPKAKRR